LVEKLIAQVVRFSIIIRKMSVFINYNLEIGIRERRTAKSERKRQTANGIRLKVEGKGKKVYGMRFRGKAKGKRQKE